MVTFVLRALSSDRRRKYCTALSTFRFCKFIQPSQPILKGCNLLIDSSQYHGSLWLSTQLWSFLSDSRTASSLLSWQCPIEVAATSVVLSATFLRRVAQPRHTVPSFEPSAADASACFFVILSLYLDLPLLNQKKLWYDCIKDFFGSSSILEDDASRLCDFALRSKPTLWLSKTTSLHLCPRAVNTINETDFFSGLSMAQTTIPKSASWSKFVCLGTTGTWKKGNFLVRRQAKPYCKRTFYLLPSLNHDHQAIDDHISIVCFSLSKLELDFHSIFKSEFLHFSWWPWWAHSISCN